jgi:hypothetical protein
VAEGLPAPWNGLDVRSKPAARDRDDHFARAIRKSGYAELVRLIRVKRDQLLKSKRAAAN